VTLVHEYETDPSTRRYERLHLEERRMALSAIDCVLNGQKGVYASSELTTGTRTYEALGKNGFRTAAELADPHRSALLEKNIEEAGAFARRLREGLGGAAPVITPAPFLAPGWTQAEYLAFWEELIRTRVKAVYFNDGWEFSNGCSFEFAVAREAGIPCFDARLQPLSLDDGIARVERAVADLEARSFDPERLRLNLARLRRLR
jgi:hypothetical protein